MVPSFHFVEVAPNGAVWRALQELHQEPHLLQDLHQELDQQTRTVDRVWLVRLVSLRQLR